MGNEKSIPSGLKIEEIIKISDAWIQKSAILSNEMTQICVFEQFLRDENVQALQNLSKNLMLYRHPYILKYISSWRTNKTLYVATEFGKPLSLVIQDLMPMQLCIGLFNILKAIIFLQDMALSSHNNISKDAIYVTTEGHWKLGRLELMTSKPDIVGNSSVKSTSNGSTDSSDSVDQKGFASLATEILQNTTNDNVPGVDEFKQFCKVNTTSITSNPQFFQQLYAHPFFSHRFVNIYNFLCELPAKNESEKASFFTTLADELQPFPEVVVACQLGSLLLSRLVLLNETAQEFFLSKLFTPKDDENSCLFSTSTLQKYILPRLLNMFCVRDSQIRLILMRNFSLFGSIFTKEQLQNKILPELLVGIKDTNEVLVSTTLHTLADLVPILGASVVIGKGRAKLFADGRPLLKRESIKDEETTTSQSSPSLELLESNCFTLPERLSPDGGEDSTESTAILESDTIPIQNTKYEELAPKMMKINKLVLHENNSDTLPNNELFLEDKKPKNNATGTTVSINDVKRPQRENLYQSAMKINDDLTTLDIKCSRSKNDVPFDDIELMFKDMEPVISRTAVMNIPNTAKAINNENKFKAAEVGVENFDGWGDDVTDWVNADEVE